MKHFWKEIKDSNMFNFEDVYTMLVEQCRPGGQIVEIGSWVGQSYAFLLVECLNSGKFIKAVSVDAFLGNVHGGAEIPTRPQWELFRKNLGPVWTQAHVIKSLSADAANYFALGSCDAVFIDADHHYEAVKQDIFQWWPRVRSGGWFTGHDIKHAPIEQAVKEHADLYGVPWKRQGNCWLIQKP